jgi:hypothetical protein
MNGQAEYLQFLESKAQVGSPGGFEPVWLPDFLYDFQRALVGWAVRRGRAAVFAACGMGKTPIFLAWAENVVRHTNRPVLVMTTLGDSDQTLREAAKFGVEAVRSRDGKLPPGARVVITNYERLRHFDPRDFAGAVANEAGILKNFKGKTRAAVTEFLRTLPYRLLCTATPSPNDYVELGTSSEALGELGHQDMIIRFFVKHLAARGTLGWGREQYRMKGHAEIPFWRWVCSWARACRKPSDLGDFNDGPFALPELAVREHVVESARPPDGFLFDMPAVTLEDQESELRRTLRQRCEKAAALLDHGRPAVAWCNRNAEGRLLARLVRGAVEVSGADDDDAKEGKLEAFASGEARVLVTKPKVAGFGLNFQHCAHMTFFVGHSWEQWHQCVRRCWRYGQAEPVGVDVITTPGLLGVSANLRRKEEKVDRMFGRLVALMLHAERSGRTGYGVKTEEVPTWLSSTRI